MNQKNITILKLEKGYKVIRHFGDSDDERIVLGGDAILETVASFLNEDGLEASSVKSLKREISLKEAEIQAQKEEISVLESKA